MQVRIERDGSYNKEFAVKVVTSDMEKVEKTTVKIQHVHGYTNTCIDIYILVYPCSLI